MFRKTVYRIIRLVGTGIIGALMIPAALALAGVRIVWNIMDSLLARLDKGDENESKEKNNENT